MGEGGGESQAGKGREQAKWLGVGLRDDRAGKDGEMEVQLVHIAFPGGDWAIKANVFSSLVLFFVKALAAVFGVGRPRLVI